ncbi:biotin transport system substrate-specific component [Bacillus pakistanensis]|uniref:Biotin transporter n=1 Tax=Rossellomorea pakistanensis TaxID=992288 RepID=A0ABS2N7H0_9BACI|nr:biotin transporter BioY [Bacillus pakistanensis]MBM7583802.1 biotin transport system substrate-specific component [Bacillus pakistanensis]
MKKFTTLDLTLGAIFVAMMTVGANITSIAPFMVVGGIPITLQTFFAILSGVVLGSRLGAFAMFTYALLGLVGVPVYAGFKGGMVSLISPTFGFILSFILTAFVAGKLIEKKRSFKMFIFAALIGMTINYVFGTNWMYLAYKLWFTAPEGFTYKMAWLWMVVPLPKDILLAIVAGIMAFRLEKSILSKRRFKHIKKVA